MNWIKTFRLLLLPLAWLYGIAISIRNYLFNSGKFVSQSFSIPVISIGNLTVGGTGKTPATEYIVRLLQKQYRIATLSRGYKRNTKGVVISDEKSTVAEIGDEPLQMKRKFPNLQVAVAERRTDGISALLSSENLPQVILLDDAYQHRYVLPGLSILVIDYHRPIWKDFLLPAGNLREYVSGKKRADIILFSKCPNDISEVKKNEYLRKLMPSENQNVYFSNVKYSEAIPLSMSDKHSSSLSIDGETEIIVITGIATPKPFINYLKQKTKQVHLLAFPDHHNFNNKDLEIIQKKYSQLNDANKVIITTEKDATRLREIDHLIQELKDNIWYIPIEMHILFDQQKQFEDNIIEYVNKDREDSKIHSRKITHQG